MAKKKRERVKVKNPDGRRKNSGTPGNNGGGAKKGAGFPKGQSKTDTQKIRELRNQALHDGGEMPHMLLLRISRGDPVECYNEAGEEITHYPTYSDRKEAAKDCAQFFCPKLRTTELTGKDEGPVRLWDIDPRRLEGVPKDKIEQLEKLLDEITNGENPQQRKSRNYSNYAETIY